MFVSVCARLREREKAREREKEEEWEREGTIKKNSAGEGFSQLSHQKSRHGLIPFLEKHVCTPS